MSGYLLDTHVLLWWAFGVAKLNPSQKKILEGDAQSEGKLCLSQMSLWEIATLHSLGRIHLDISLRDWFEHLERNSKIQFFGVDAKVSVESAYLRQSLPGDPVDQILAATAKVHNLSLLTADKRLRKLQGLVVI